MSEPAAAAKAAADRLIDALERPTELAAETAAALVDAAQAAARSRPTPQAAMVAAGFSADNGVISGPSGTLGALTMGAEFGSTIYAQFGSRHGGGSWLFPTLQDPPTTVDDAVDDYLEGAIDG